MFPDELQTQELGISWSNAGAVGTRIDPFLFTHRIALYKSLVSASNIDGYFGEKNERNPLWGLAYQHQWQKSSGRLGTDGPTDAIDPDSAWSYGNFTLSVIPYLGAIAAKTVPDIHVLPPPRESRFDHAFGEDAAHRTVPAELIPAISDWQDYFEHVARVKHGDDDEPLRIALWKAHKTSLDVVAEKTADLSPLLYSQPELDFLTGWCRMVDMLAACAWRTDHDAMMDGGVDVLPERPLEREDVESNLEAFPDSVRSNIESVLGLAHMSKRRIGIMLWFWRRMMRTRRARDGASDILNTLFDAKASTSDRMRLLRLIF